MKNKKLTKWTLIKKIVQRAAVWALIGLAATLLGDSVLGKLFYYYAAFNLFPLIYVAYKYIFEKTCEECNGSGLVAATSDKYETEDCDTCAGTGYVSRKKPYKKGIDLLFVDIVSKVITLMIILTIVGFGIPYLIAENFVPIMLVNNIDNLQYQNILLYWIVFGLSRLVFSLSYIIPMFLTLNIMHKLNYLRPRQDTTQTIFSKGSTIGNIWLSVLSIVAAILYSEMLIRMALFL